jgi:hypothetical protein
MFDPTIIAALIGAIAAVAIAIIPFAMKRREARTSGKSPAPGTVVPAERNVTEDSEPGSDLRISSLDGFMRLQQLDGHPTIEYSGRTVHCGGCKVEFELSHNGLGREPITLLGMIPVVTDFDASRHTGLDYQLAGDELHAAGTAHVHEFRLTIIDGQVQPGKWILDPTSGSFERCDDSGNMLSAKAFDAQDSNQFKFLHDEADANTIRGFVLSVGVGLFALHFEFVYSVGGQERRHSSEKVWLYSRN